MDINDSRAIPLVWPLLFSSIAGIASSKMSFQSRVSLSLLLLRLTIALVFFMWTLQKFLYPEQASNVYEMFFFVPSLVPTLVQVIAVLETILLVAFVTGFKKHITYWVIVACHSLSTGAALLKYFEPFRGPNLLFFAAWPMLAACFTLAMLQRWDTWLTLRSVTKAFTVRD